MPLDEDAAQAESPSLPPEGVNPIGQEDQLDAEFPVGTVRAHANDPPTGVADQVRHHCAADHERPFCLRLLGEPTIEFGPSNGKGIVLPFTRENRIPI